MIKVELNDGREFETNFCGASQGILWIRLMDENTTVLEAATIFSNQDATQKIVAVYDAEVSIVTFEAYTNLVTVQKELEGTVLIALKKQS